MEKGERLNPRKDRFCLLVSEGVKLVDAFNQAGYKSKWPVQNSHHLYKELKPKIDELILAKKDEIQKRYALDRDKIMLELGKIIHEGTTSNRDKIAACMAAAKLMGLDINYNANLNIEQKTPQDMDINELKQYLLSIKTGGKNDK